MEDIVEMINTEEVEEETIVFRNGESLEQVYILMEGEVQTFLQFADEIFVLDTMSEPGCIFGECAFLNKKEGVNFCL